MPLPPDENSSDRESVSLVDLAWVHGKIGLLSFGGGVSGLVYQEVVLKRKWIDEKEFFSGLALCQVLPGVNIGNLAVYVGQSLRGTIGAIAALGGMLAGPFLIVIGISLVYEKISNIAWVAATLNGVAAAALGLLIMIAIKGARQAARTSFGLPILLMATVSIGILHWPLMPVILVLTPISVIFARFAGQRDV